MTTAPSRTDEAAFGIVYGSISVLAVLVLVHPPIEDPARQALILFGSVLAMALAKAYAELCQRMVQSGEKARWADIKAVWSHSQTVLLAANGPTLAFLLAAAGLYDPDLALPIAQILAIGLLAGFGARIGWRIGKSRLSSAVGAGITGGLGLALSLLKALAH